MSLAAFSQTATSNKLICFPDSTAKRIAIDLVKGDSAKAELTATKKLVNQLEEKSVASQKIINFYVDKSANYETQIDLYKKKETKYLEVVTGLETDVKRANNKAKIFKYVSIGLTATYGAGLLLMLIQ
jgi:hypothetical protein